MSFDPTDIRVPVQGLSIWDPRIGPRYDPRAWVAGGNNPALVMLDRLDRDPELRRRLWREKRHHLPWWRRWYYGVRMKVFGWPPGLDLTTFIELADYCDELIPNTRVNGVVGEI